MSRHVRRFVSFLFSRPHVTSALLLILCGGVSSAGELGKVYFTDYLDEAIKRIDPDGSNVEIVLPDTSGFHMHIAGHKLYWQENGGIWRADLDGSDVESLLPVGLVRRFAVDLTGQKIYWTDSQDRKIRRANLDGTDIEDIIVYEFAAPSGIALDVPGGKVYYTLPHLIDDVLRANLDGSDIETLLYNTGLEPGDIALDLVHGKLYLANTEDSRIAQANLDGSDLALVLNRGPDFYYEPVNIALSPNTDMLYVSAFGGIVRANLDGSNAEILFEEAGFLATGIAIDLCGDGMVDQGEVCDDGNVVEGDGCDSNCTLTACGNGIVTTGEECDDGNNDSCDGCSSTCEFDIESFCGDGTVNTTCGEECDDGGQSATCDADCTFAVCGDGTLNTTAGEQCDDGNNVDGDGCQGNCLLPVCGDGIHDPGEQCDDGNNMDGDGCQGNCLLPVCGDGIHDPGEQCDDGNNVDGDGCNSDCTLPDPVPATSNRTLLVLILLLLTASTAALLWRRGTVNLKQ